jgi:hypothetical protein
MLGDDCSPVGLSRVINVHTNETVPRSVYICLEVEDGPFCSYELKMNHVLNIAN